MSKLLLLIPNKKICKDCDFPKIIRDFEQENKRLREDRDWIDVKNKLPDNDGNYITCVREIEIQEGNKVVVFYTEINIFANKKWYDCTWNIMSVTHWIPLPKTPKEE